MSEPKWLSRIEAEQLHAKAIEMAGGAHGVRDANLLESALARPQNLYAYGERDRFQLAASYAEGVARNHAFVEGNKRTAFMVADLFLFKNGHELLPREDDGYVDIMERLAQGQVSRELMADYLKANSQPIATQDEAQPQGKHGAADWTARAQQLRTEHGEAANPDHEPKQGPRGPRMRR